MIGNTVFRARDGGQPVDWGVVFRDLGFRLAAEVGKLKSIPISPFLFHMYESKGILTKEEETKYKTAQELQGYRITPEPGSRPQSEDEGQEEDTRDPQTPATSLVREELARP